MQGWLEDGMSVEDIIAKAYAKGWKGDDVVVMYQMQDKEESERGQLTLHDLWQLKVDNVINHDVIQASLALLQVIVANNKCP